MTSMDTYRIWSLSPVAGQTRHPGTVTQGQTWNATQLTKSCVWEVENRNIVESCIETKTRAVERI